MRRTGQARSYTYSLDTITIQRPEHKCNQQIKGTGYINFRPIENSAIQYRCNLVMCGRMQSQRGPQKQKSMGVQSIVYCRWISVRVITFADRDFHTL